MLRKLKSNIYVLLIARLGIVLFLYALSRICFYFFNQQMFPGIKAEEFLRMLFGGIKFDITAIIYINLLFILTQIIPFKFRHHKTYQKYCSLLFFMTNSIGLLANFADIAYYPFTLKRTTFTVFQQFSNENNLLQIVFKFLFIDYWYLTLLFVFTTFGMVWLYRRLGNPILFIKNKVWYYFMSMLMFLLFTGFCIAGMRGGFRHSTRPITISNAGEFTTEPSQINIVINTPFSIFKTLKTKPITKVEFYKDTSVLNKLYNPKHYPANKAPFTPKNVMVIIIESFSKEYLGSFNPKLDNEKYKGYTPFLDSLKNHSFSFTNAYANGRKSIEALPSVLASIPGINEPFILSYYSGNKFETLGGLLARKGYHTSFFHGAPNGSMGFSSFINLGNIKYYFGKDEYNNNEDFDGIWGIWDEPFLQYTVKKLNTFKQPFFSTLFTLSSHHPFKVPERYEGKFSKGSLEIHQTVGYTDMALRKFFSSASKQSWFKNTLFIITADHSFLASHQEYKNSLGAFAVPILLYDPSRGIGQEIKSPAQQIDIMPTILNYLNYDMAYFSFGHDLLDGQNKNFVVQTIDGFYQLIKNDYVLKHNYETGETHLYNYISDNHLKNDIAKSNQKMVVELKRNLDAFVQQYNQHMADNQLTLSP